MNSPTVTIVIPVYRRIRYLREAVPTALAQTFRDFEVIVSDDGPSDEIAAYVASIGDPRLRYRRNATNLGIALNHAAAFGEARGRYIATLHDDDLLEPEFLATLVPPLEADESIAVSFCDHQIIDEAGRVKPEATEHNTRFFRRDRLMPGRHQPFLILAAIHQAIPMAMGAVFRKSILEGAEYPAEIGGCYDHWLSYLAASQARAVFYVPQRLSRYRTHLEAGSFQRGKQNLKDAIYVRQRLLEDPALATSRREITNSIGIYEGKLALMYMADGDKELARTTAVRAFSHINRAKNHAGLLKNLLAQVLKGRRK